MNDSSSDCQLNHSKVDYCFESNEVPEMWFNSIYPSFNMFLCDVDEQFIPKVGMTFNTLEDAAKFYKDYSKVAGFSTRTNPSAGLNCPARIYILILKDIGVWIISKVVLHHLHSYCANQVEMLKQHRKLSMSVHRTIENNEKVRIKPSKTYQ
ncbi:hypothetical protein Ahy_A07g033184 [Arachis hypogaea]|uniref:FAR1 domain-containing protein n=1 Tax=Arachis hypogaea TaxID=3818 RepID=A0A445C8Q2_ARAHY|nr:hypothetical protein Ahy_A07g033184 [Arachis hypogaea]